MPIKLTNKPVDRYGKFTPECAKYVNGQLAMNGINSWGDAPEINSQFKEIFNGYDASDFNRKTANLGTTHRDSVKNIRAIHNRASDAVRKDFDSKTLNKDHLYTVNMYYKTSPHMVDFYNKGTNTPGTHVGVLYWEPDMKQWRVKHNIHGEVKDNNFISLQGGNKAYGVTAIADASNIPLTKQVKLYLKKLLGYK